MRQVPLLFPFFIATFFAFFGTALFPQVKFFAFSPFLALLYNRTHFHTSLWIASLCGLMVDLLSSEFRLGIHALSYCLATFLLYQQKKHFFEDKLLALSIFTLLIGSTASIIELLLISIFDRALPLSMGMFLTDLILMPLFDAVYAFLCFCCPILLYLHVKKVGWKTIYFRILKACRLSIHENDSKET